MKKTRENENSKLDLIELIKKVNENQAAKIDILTQKKNK
jgi:hypothetical protein